MKPVVNLATVIILSALYQHANADNSNINENTQAPQNTEVKTLAPLIVTGTRTKNRSLTDSLQPIDVISAEDLVQRTGSQELATALSRLVPSINFPRPTVVDGTEIVRPAQLKGLSPDQVLVLVNGKRRHNSAFINLGGTIGRGSAPADLNAIPISAINRIEVLRDGASARYGSDAIAGVINIILKSDPSHGEVGVKYGQYKEGDGEQKQSFASGGFDLNHGQGFLNFAAEWQDSAATNRAGQDYRNAASTTYGQQTFRFGDPDSQDVKLALNSGYYLTDSAELYGFATYSHRKAETGAFYRLSNASNNIPALFPNGYLPLINATVEDIAAVAGIKGQIGTWDYDASINFGQNQYQVDTRTVNVDLYNDTGSTPLYFHNGELSYQQQLVNLDFNREFNLSALQHPLNVAFGAQYFNQEYEIKAGDPESYYKGGSSGLAGFRNADAGKWSRDSYAGYLDLETNLTDKLSTSLAYRYEHYDDFGDSNNGSLAFRYAFTPSVAFRANASTGFRAPGLAQLYYTQTSSQLINGNLVEAGTFPASSRIAHLLGAEDLKPEKSKSFSAGIVFTPNDQFYLTLDAYQIDIKDRISLSSSISANSAAVQQYLAENGITDTSFSTVRYFNNASDTQTRGVDLVASYKWDQLPHGKLNTSLAYNYNRNKVTHVDGNPEVLNALGLTLARLDRREQFGLLAGSIPEHKLSLNTDYQLGNFGINTTLTRYGSFRTYSNSGPEKDQYFSAKWLLDLSLSYQYNNWNFIVGGDNITDVYPDKDVYDINQPTGGSLQYSQFSPFGFNGAFYYAKASYRW
ncbi:TonB-dependent receptor [Acinetobacter qingfengensis]|uniref:Ligand-gated channel n=1 Tax=Acinetobacter qingfengensis TaxID=1262585 RepID=A0A1E7R4X1_9GAMM|nr:TonB-dependent receptor [Acinetobacter qingfengensis]KAA8732373.1 TonB-dependent receptor [Acinetobacter qingfengensis]OEY94368.1 ligand-gated channel [Acinetobacter qingfengensis]